MDKQQSKTYFDFASKRRPSIIFGAAVLGIVVTLGLLYWLGWPRPTQLATVTATPTQTLVTTPSVTETSLPPAPTINHTPKATATQTSTPLPPTNTASATNTPTTETTPTPEIVAETTAQPTPSPWPTTDPLWLVKPPLLSISASRTSGFPGPLMAIITHLPSTGLA